MKELNSIIDGRWRDQVAISLEMPKTIKSNLVDHKRRAKGSHFCRYCSMYALIFFASLIAMLWARSRFVCDGFSVTLRSIPRTDMPNTTFGITSDSGYVSLLTATIVDPSNHACLANSMLASHVSIGQSPRRLESFKYELSGWGMRIYRSRFPSSESTRELNIVGISHFSLAMAFTLACSVQFIVLRKRRIRRIVDVQATNYTALQQDQRDFPSRPKTHKADGS